MSDAKPYSKETQLHRPQRRYRRRVASPKQWAAISAAKLGPCRICGAQANNGRLYGHIHLHHLVTRQDGGDDVAENIVPLCPVCHDGVTRRNRGLCLVLMLTLTDEEHAYMERRGGYDYARRVYGIEVRP